MIENKKEKKSLFINKRVFLMSLILVVMVVFLFILAFESTNKNFQIIKNFNINTTENTQIQSKQIQEPFFMYTPIFYVPFLLFLIGIVIIEIYWKYIEKNKKTLKI